MLFVAALSTARASRWMYSCPTSGLAAAFNLARHSLRDGLPSFSWVMNSRLKCNSMFQEYLVGSFEAEAFSGSVVIAFEVEGEAMCWQGIEVGVSGQLAAQTTDRVFDAALLPRRVRVAEPGLDPEPSAQEIVFAELRSIIERDGLAGARGHRFHQGANSPWCKSGFVGGKFWGIHRVCP